MDYLEFTDKQERRLREKVVTHETKTTNVNLYLENKATKKRFSHSQLCISTTSTYNIIIIHKLKSPMSVLLNTVH